MPMHAWSLAVSVALVLLGAVVLAWILRRRRAHPVDNAQATAVVALPSVAPSETPTDAQSSYGAACAEALQRLHAIAFGTDLSADREASASREALGKTVRTRLVQIIEEPNYAPRRPMLLPRLIQAMRNDEVSRRELARIISTDPVLAGNLVRLANSPVYRHSEDAIESLDRAVAVLGTEGMRSLTTAALLQPVFRITGRHFARFGEITWQHTFLAASAAEAHAAVVEDSDPFAAQLLGLIMGLATIVVFRVASDAYVEGRRTPVAATIAALIDTDLVPVARQIAASWELSERMDAALADQAAAPGAQLSSLGRSLQFGRFAAALAMLRARALIDDAAVSAALGTGGAETQAFTRIWTRLLATQA